MVEITGHVTDLASLDFGDKLASLKVEGVCRWEIFQGESQAFRLDNKMHFAYELCFQAGTTREVARSSSVASHTLAYQVLELY